MKVLLVSKDMGESTSLAEAVRNAGHEPVLAMDAQAAVAAFQNTPPAVALLCSPAPDAALATTVRTLRRLGNASDSVLAVVTRDAAEDQLTSMYEAGADADLRSPVGEAHMRARLGAFERVLRHRAGVAPIATPAPPSPPAARPVPAPPPAGTPLEPIDACSQMNGWRQAATILQAGTSKMLNLPATVADIGHAKQPYTVASTILLSSPEQLLELRVTLGMNDTTARKIAMHMFGEEDETLIPDMVGELGNIYMGVLKTAFLESKLSFTGGLPQAADPLTVLRPQVFYKFQDAFAIVVNDVPIAVHLGLRSKANLFLKRMELREGMVLVKDVFNARGLLMVKGGTRLSLTMIEKLQGVLPAGTQVEVTAP